MNQSFTASAIGVFHAVEQYRYDAARQGVVARENEGQVRLNPKCNFEQALTDLAGFSRIWLIYWFDRNDAWKPMIRPPRGSRKVGVFASRAPYRPNPIGMSCVELVSVKNLTLYVRGHDLLDGTPILDIKPYLPYADSFPDAACGWVDAVESDRFQVGFASLADRQLAWLDQHGAGCVRAFLLQQLESNPTDSSRKRVCRVNDDVWEIAYRTWRALFEIDQGCRRIEVVKIFSGYSQEDLALRDDPYADKQLHRLFEVNCQIENK